MNPSKRRIKCSRCDEKVDAEEELLCKDCVEEIANDKYDNGFSDGKEEGYKKGVEDGKEEGYANGYQEAMKEASKKIDEVLYKLKR